MADLTTIIFDFDGTIADSFEKYMEVNIEIVNKYGLGECNKADIQLYKEKGVQAFIEKAKIPVDKIPFIISKGREEMAKLIGTIKPFGGMADVLKELRSRGTVLGILTTNAEDNVSIFLRNSSIDYFDFVYSESRLFEKDKALRRLISDKKLDSENVVYVGDEVRDIQAAKSAGIKSVAVTWGSNTRKLLSEENPDWIIDRPSELLTILK